MAGEHIVAINEQPANTQATSDGEATPALTTQYSALSTPAALPRPTYWPVVMAAGIVFMTWGIATTLAISAIGLALFALALGGWIGDWRHGH